MDEHQDFRLTKNENAGRKKKKSLSRAKRSLIILLVCVSVFAVAAVGFTYAIWLRRPRTPDVHVELPDTIKVETYSESETETETEREMLPYMAELYEQNPDVVGYMHIEGTRIDGPVVYTKGEDEYLYKNFEGEEDEEGCLFVDKRNTLEPRDDNLIIYGHYTNSGLRFRDLHNYKDYNYYKDRNIIRFDSLYEAAKYEIVSVFVSQVYNVEDDVFKFYKFYDADNKEEYDDFIKNIKELQLYDTGVTAEYGDELITLVTCEYSRDNGRMVVVAKKITDSDDDAFDVEDMSGSESVADGVE